MSREEQKRSYAAAWVHFQTYADGFGIPTDNEEDWGPWWDCFVEGLRCMGVAI